MANHTSGPVILFTIFSGSFVQALLQVPLPENICCHTQRLPCERSTKNPDCFRLYSIAGTILPICIGFMIDITRVLLSNQYHGMQHVCFFSVAHVSWRDVVGSDFCFFCENRTFWSCNTWTKTLAPSWTYWWIEHSGISAQLFLLYQAGVPSGSRNGGHMGIGVLLWKGCRTLRGLGSLFEVSRIRPRWIEFVMTRFFQPTSTWFAQTCGAIIILAAFHVRICR